MKKFLAVIMALTLCFSLLALAGCSKEETNDVDSSTDTATEATSTESDLDYVKSNGKLVVGITDFAPMDYQEDGKWIGFDADMATKFAETLGVDVEFIEIEWDNKVFELDSKAIDCVWNGMTLDDQVKAAMDCSQAYCNNAQIVVVPVDVADSYKTEDSIKGLKFAVEASSAGKKIAEANGYSFTEVQSQADALMEVASGTSEAAIIDSLMAAAMVGEGTGYENLMYTVPLTTEEYGVGFRKGSDIVEKLNAFFEQCKTDGTLEEIAEKYGVQAAVIK